MKTIRRVFCVSIIPSVFALAIGCGGSDKQPAQSPETAPGAPVTTTSNNAVTPNSVPARDPSSGAGDFTSSNTTAPTSTTLPLTDEQILRITNVANLGEIEQARIAQLKAKDQRVRRFAAMMMKDHGEAEAKGNELAKRRGLTPFDSPISATLKSDSDTAVQRLSMVQSGSDFDRAYIDAQVNAHQTVLDTIDNKLLPNVKGAELKTMLENVRTKVRGHLQEAREIQTTLATR